MTNERDKPSDSGSGDAPAERPSNTEPIVDRPRELPSGPDNPIFKGGWNGGDVTSVESGESGEGE
jgi:hypothetical protein